MTLLLAINSAGDSWALEKWRERFRAVLPGHTIVMEGVDPYAPESIRYAGVWKPRPGLLAGLPKLAAIFNLGAGVDALLTDPTLPTHVPLTRIVNTDLTKRMTEYVVLHVLLHHRRMPMLLEAQRDKQWRAKDQWAASAVRVASWG